MSNARQALAAARQMQAEQAAPNDMADAQRNLDAAQAALDSGDFSTAREDALKARELALKALTISQQRDAKGRTPP